MVPRRLFSMSMSGMRAAAFPLTGRLPKCRNRLHTLSLQDVVHGPEEAGSIAHFPQRTKCQRVQPLLLDFSAVPAIQP